MVEDSDCVLKGGVGRSNRYRNWNRGIACFPLAKRSSRLWNLGLRTYILSSLDLKLGKRTLMGPLIYISIEPQVMLCGIISATWILRMESLNISQAFKYEPLVPCLVQYFGHRLLCHWGPDSEHCLFLRN